MKFMEKYLFLTKIFILMVWTLKYIVKSKFFFLKNNNYIFIDFPPIIIILSFPQIFIILRSNVYDFFFYELKLFYLFILFLLRLVHTSKHQALSVTFK